MDGQHHCHQARFDRESESTKISGEEAQDRAAWKLELKVIGQKH